MLQQRVDVVTGKAKFQALDEIALYSEPVADGAEDTVRVTLLNGDGCSLKTMPGQTVGNLRGHAANAFGLDPLQSKLVYGDKILCVDESLEACGVSAGAQLQLVVALFSKLGDATKIVFVIDLSGSMSSPVSSAPGKPARIKLAKENVKMALRALEFDCEFGFVTFTSQARPRMGGTLHPVSEINNKKACDEIDSWEASGGTLAAPALAAALSMLKEVDAEHAGLIFFLSDGEWSGNPFPTSTTTEKGYPIRVEVIAIGQTGGGLQELATSTGGEHQLCTDQLMIY